MAGSVGGAFKQAQRRTVPRIPILERRDMLSRPFNAQGAGMPGTGVTDFTGGYVGNEVKSRSNEGFSRAPKNGMQTSVNLVEEPAGISGHRHKFLEQTPHNGGDQG